MIRTGRLYALFLMCAFAVVTPIAWAGKPTPKYKSQVQVCDDCEEELPDPWFFNDIPGQCPVTWINATNVTCLSTGDVQFHLSIETIEAIPFVFTVDGCNMSDVIMLNRQEDQIIHFDSLSFGVELEPGQYYFDVVLLESSFDTCRLRIDEPGPCGEWRRDVDLPICDACQTRECAIPNLPGQSFAGLPLDHFEMIGDQLRCALPRHRCQRIQWYQWDQRGTQFDDNCTSVMIVHFCHDVDFMNVAATDPLQITTLQPEIVHVADQVDQEFVLPETTTTAVLVHESDCSASIFRIRFDEFAETVFGEMGYM